MWPRCSARVRPRRPREAARSAASERHTSPLSTASLVDRCATSPVGGAGGGGWRSLWGGGRPQVASGRLLLRAARRERRGARRGVLLRRRRLWLARGRGARPGRTAARDHGPRLLVPLFHHAARVQPVPRLLRVPRLDGGPFAARLLVCTGAPARKLLRRARGPQLGRPCVGPRLASRRAERRPLLRARRRCFASRSAVRLRAAHLHASRCEEQAARAARSARRAARRRRRARQPPSSSRRRGCSRDGAEPPPRGTKVHQISPRCD